MVGASSVEKKKTPYLKQAGITSAQNKLHGTEGTHIPSAWQRKTAKSDLVVLIQTWNSGRKLESAALVPMHRWI